MRRWPRRRPPGVPPTARARRGATAAIAGTDAAAVDHRSTGGSAAKPVGTVWFGWATPSGVTTDMRLFAGDRAAVRAAAVHHALHTLHTLLT